MLRLAEARHESSLDFLMSAMRKHGSPEIFVRGLLGSYGPAQKEMALKIDRKRGVGRTIARELSLVDPTARAGNAPVPADANFSEACLGPSSRQ